MRQRAPGAGRKPTPTAQLKKRKSQKVKERLATEPQPEPGRPTRPRGLVGDARKTWDRLVPLMDAAGMLTKTDGETLERYCKLAAHWHAISSYEPEKLEVKTVDDLRVVQNHLYVQLKVNDALLKLEVQFGMTPASRPNVKRLEKPAHGNAKEQGKLRFFNAS